MVIVYVCASDGGVGSGVVYTIEVQLLLRNFPASSKKPLTLTVALILMKYDNELLFNESLPGDWRLPLRSTHDVISISLAYQTLSSSTVQWVAP